ncbi:MAG: PKD domain-containing protein, partial [Euryarchaeota archaeon]|nr:PKD domain-containing protein [Euryarchaeota archaeon]
SGGNSYSWSQSSTNLGCTFANAVSVSCVPTTSGSYSASVDITDSNGGSSGTLTSPSLTVDPALSTSAPTPSKTAVDVGQPVTFSTTATGGSGTYTSYAWTPSGAGLGCASSTTSSITCTPTTSGSYTISVTVTDSNGWTSPSATSASFTVDPALTTSAPAPNKWSVDTGQPVSFSTTASGGSSSYSSYAWTPSGAGLGCTASTTATITCTPTSAGAYTISVKVTDSNGWTSPSATSASFTVFAAPTATTPSANRTSADIGQSITFSTTISGGSSGTTSVLSWSGLTTLGCASANATSITCVPTTGGSTTITVTVTDSNGGTSTSSALSYTVASDPATSTPTATPSTAETGQTVSFSTTPSGGSGTYNYYWSGLPTGCSTSNVDPLPCTPSAAGTSSVVVTVVDSNGFPVASAALSFTVSAGPTVTTPSATPTASDVGTSITFSVTASGGSGSFPTYAWSDLPTGCTGANAATTTCVPTAAGTFHVGMNVTDSLGGVAASGLLTYVVSAVPTVGTPTATPASVDIGQSTSITAVVSGGASPLTYAWSGLPIGCSGTTLTITCTPTAAGASSITLKVTDANSGTATSSALAFTVYALPTLSAPVASPNPVNVGATLSLSTTLTGGAPSDTYAWSGLPTGCTGANAATFTCTPSTAGTYSTKVAVTDGNGGTGTSSATSITVSSGGGGGSPTVSLVANPA